MLDTLVVIMEKKSTSSHGHGQSELECYLKENLVSRTLDFDILSFSTAGKVVSPHRNRIHSDTLQAVMCSQDWLWADIKVFTSVDSHHSSLSSLDPPSPIAIIHPRRSSSLLSVIVGRQFVISCLSPSQDSIIKDVRLHLETLIGLVRGSEQMFG
ncbi:hypothetical protein Patl1_19815 [Pistacia atlantica]|uniref:Uncharacterized protein n=1 Tax=Pistacia atlantica TaxID=434234 RepID=A0ACC1BJN2_9ROSI|nr:hypothetical protein Patl1_19815 [Pistacia atlantica]